MNQALKNKLADLESMKVIEGGRIINRNPANIKEIVSEHSISSQVQLDEMLQKSAKAFKKWSKVPAPKRAQYLLAAAKIFSERKEDLVRQLHRENGKSMEEARGEIQEVVDTLEFFAGEGRRIYGMTGQSEMPNKSIITIRQPIGPAVFISAWNFPSAVPSWKAAPALVSGNTFILKPSELAPLSGKLFVDILNEVGLPEGVAQIAYGAGDVGDYLIRAEDTKIVSFTGSVPVGREIAKIAAENFKKCALELGGKNSAIVLADANLELAEDGVLWGAYGTAGQRCTSTSRLIIDKRISKDFINRLKSKASLFYDKIKHKAAANYAPIISSRQLRRIDSLVQEAIKEGAELICGGEILDDGESIGLKQGYYYAPTILKVTPKMSIAKTEVFGPVLSVIEIDSQSKAAEQVLSEALNISNAVNYGLSNSIYTANINLAMRAAHDFESGLVYVNAPTIGAECGGASLFGGWKETGNGGREGGITVLDTYTQYKTIAIDYSDKLQRAQID
jgi:aldehyde dehydrogenase (NAD+)